MGGSDAYRARQFHGQAAAAMRYAQRLATASRCRVTVTLSAGSPPGYSLSQPSGAACSGSQPVTRPSGGGAYADLASGSVTLSGSATVVFQPSSDASVLGFPVTISGGGFSGSLNVIPATAYVQATP